MARTYITGKRIIQPLYQKYRNIFRGPRSSQKENLEMNKFLIDVKILDEKIDSINTKIYDDARIIVGQIDPEQPVIHDQYQDGKLYEFSDIQIYVYDNSSTPVQLAIDTLDTISSKLVRIEQKVKILENKKES